MIDKNSILKMVDHVFHRSQGYTDRRLIHPQRDWVIGVSVFAVLVLTGSVIAGNVFVAYQNIDSDTSDLTETLPKYKEGIIQNVLQSQRIQKQEYQNLRNDIIPVIVPEVATSTEEVLDIEEVDLEGEE